MTDMRFWMKLIANTTQDECREVGDIFLSFADTPRDAEWRQRLAAQIASMPEQPKSDLAQWISEGNARVQAANDALWATGWHPEQMRAKLVELGYRGSAEIS